MNLEAESVGDGRSRGYPARHRVIRSFALVCLFMAAFTLRIYHITDPPLGYHPNRQMTTANCARWFYVRSRPDVPGWEREVACNHYEGGGSMMGMGATESLAATAYRIAGGEYLWLPAVMSLVFYLIGGVFLFWLASTLFAWEAAFLSTAYYLFLPWAVVASRSFQTEPLLVMLLIITWFLILRHHKAPSTWLLVVMSVVAAFTILVRPVGIFTISALFLGLLVSRHGLRKAIFSKELLQFALLVLLPTVTYYVWRLSGNSVLADYGTFFPSFWTRGFFWKGWLHILRDTIGYPALTAAMVGTLILRREARPVLPFSLWVGYFVYGLVFGYHIHTHDYYSLQLVPIVALSMCPLAGVVLGELGKTDHLRMRQVAACCLVAFALLLSARDARSRLIFPESVEIVKSYAEIGRLVQHSRNTVSLDSSYGTALGYYGKLYGRCWPSTGEMEAQAKKGRQPLAAVNPGEALEELRSKYRPTYFIVTYLEDFERQPVLRRLLDERYILTAKSKYYLVYDLRQARSAQHPPVQ